MKDFKTMPKMACGGKVKKYGIGGAIKKIATGLAPAAFMGTAVAPAVYKDLTSGYSAKQREAREEKEAEETTKKEPEAKKKGGTVRRNKK